MAGLAARIDGLPLVLAGPLVRRIGAVTDPPAATVWLALRLPRRVRLEIYPASGARTWVLRGSAPTVRIGERLHIVAVTAGEPATTGFQLTAGATFRYNVFFEAHPDTTASNDDRRQGDLFTPGILGPAGTAEDLLIYGAGAPDLPSFVVPPSSLDQLRILHASCRKFKGDGRDAFPAIDFIFEKHFAEPSSEPIRPTMLFLTGDQIYADGPSRKMLRTITDAAGVLLGWDEPMPGIDQPLSEVDADRIVRTDIETGVATPNLWPALGLGEYLALYLLTFSHVLWPEDLHDEFDGFFAGMPATRRAFANIATYMIFDDHETADSWFLTFDWCREVLQRPIGRRLLQNALTAYALCQGWGNTPERFASGPGAAFLTAIQGWSRDQGDAASPHLARLVQILVVPDLTAATPPLRLADFRGPDSLDWHYTVSCGAVHISVFDMITWRSFDTQYSSADHLSSAALAAQSPGAAADAQVVVAVISNIAINRPPSASEALQHLDSSPGWSGWNKAEVALGVVVAAAAVVSFFVFPAALLGALIGWAVLRKLGAPSLGRLFRATRQVYLDERGYNYEWQSTSFERLVSHMAQQTPGTAGIRPVVFLSGDVHKSFTMRMELEIRHPFTPPDRTLRAILVQLVGSSLKYTATEGWFFDQPDPQHFAGWKREPGVDSAEHLVWRNRDPWMVRYGSGQPEPRFRADEDWRYTIAPVLPTGMAVHEFSVGGMGTPQSMVDGLKAATAYALHLARRSSAVRSNNVADVRFDAAAKKVTHRVYWWGRQESTGARRWEVTTFEADLVPTTPPPAVPR